MSAQQVQRVVNLPNYDPPSNFAPSGATDVNTAGNRINEMFDSFFKSLQASQSSAMQAEIAAADRQNAFQRDMWQKAADFNAAQADLAYSRSQTSADKVLPKEYNQEL